MSVFPIAGIYAWADRVAGGYSANGANEFLSTAGQLVLSSGRGTSKTIDNTTKIWVAAASTTFVNATSRLTLGIMDLDSGGLPDGTFDVSKELTSASGYTANAINGFLLDTAGSKSVTDGNAYALVAKWTAYGGADSIQITTSNMTRAVHPYGVVDTGSGATKQIDGDIRIMLEFADGTIGYFSAQTVIQASTMSWNSGSTPDEYAMIFQFPFPFQICGMEGAIYSLSGDFEVLLYSDPEGTPSVELTLTVDKDNTHSGGDSFSGFNWASTFNGSANTKYAVALRPTSASGITSRYISVGSGNSQLFVGSSIFGTNGYMGTRSNQTGAFSTTTYQLPAWGLRLTGFDAGGSGGGLQVHPGLVGGMRG